jgi:hypothetical protein
MGGLALAPFGKEVIHRDQFMQGTRGEDRRHDQLSWSCSPPCGPTPPPLTGLPCALLPRSTGGILALVRYHVRGCSGRVERPTSLSMGLSACAREPVSRRRTEPVPRVVRRQERDEEWVPGIWLLRWSKPVVSRARRADGMLVVSPDGAGDPHPAAPRPQSDPGTRSGWAAPIHVRLELSPVRRTTLVTLRRLQHSS